MKILHLNVKKKWFDLVAYGEKKIEYREYKPYWISRLMGNRTNTKELYFIHYDEIHIKNGFSRNGKSAPIIKLTHVKTTLERVEYPETVETKMCFCIYLGRIVYLSWGDAL